MTLHAVLPPGMVGAAVVGDWANARYGGDLVLFPEEEAALGRVGPARRWSFTAGRTAARHALAQLGVRAAPILPGARGEPRWPAGVIGSITHCRGYAAAVAAPAGRVPSVGIDAEPNDALPPIVLRRIALDAERAELRTMAGGGAVHLDRLLFSAKESVYKAWYPLTGAWLGFDDVVVTIDPATRTFTATLLVPRRRTRRAPDPRVPRPVRVRRQHRGRHRGPGAGPAGDRTCTGPAGAAYAGPVAAFVLGAVERHVGIAHDVGRAYAAVVDQRDPDAGADDDRMALDRIGRAQRRDHPRSHRLQRRLVGRGGGDHRELVAAEARDEVVAAQGPGEPIGHAADQVVADVMPERIVDVLEMVEVDVEHRGGRSAMAHLIDHRLQALAEVAAVRQAAQRIVQRQMPQPVFAFGDRGGGVAHVAETSPASSAKPASATTMNGTTLRTISVPGGFGVQVK